MSFKDQRRQKYAYMVDFFAFYDLLKFLFGGRDSLGRIDYEDYIVTGQRDSNPYL